MAKINDCIDEARKALNLFTGDELETYIKKVRERSFELNKEGVPFARDVAMKEINEDTIGILLNHESIAARNMERYNVIKHKMDNDVPIESFLHQFGKNSDYNIETAQHASQQVLYNRSFGVLNKEHLEVLENNESNDAIYAYADGVETHDPIIKAIGKQLVNYKNEREAMLVRSNAMEHSELRDDRYFRTIYDPSKLQKMGRDSFIEKMRQEIDIEKTFKYTRAMDIDGNINDALVDEMIGNSFNNIIQGNGVLFTKPVVASDAAKIERARHMFYVYKDWKSWGRADEAFGNNSLLTAWFADINVTGKQVGMAEIMGSAPTHMYNEMRHIQVKKESGKEIGIIEREKNKIKQGMNDNLFQQIIGINKTAWSPSLANIGASTRAFSGMARLGNLVSKSLTDITNIGGIAMRAGAGFWNPYFNGVIHAFDLIPSEARQILAKNMSSNLNTHMGYLSRYAESNDYGKLANKLSNKFFHSTLVTAWDGGNKLSAMEPIMRTYGKQSSKGFEALNNQQKIWLNKFNVNPLEWDALRAKTEKGLFGTDNVDKLTNDEIRELWEKGGKISPLSDYRSELYRKVFGMFDAAHQTSVLNPTAYTQMMTTWNLAPGTLKGEAVRMFMQFKGYAITNMKKVWLGGMQDFDSYQGKFMYALNMALGTMVLAGLSEALVAIGNGLTPPNPANMSNAEKAKYFSKLLAGGFGIFGKVLDPKSQRPDMVSTFFNTPSVRFASDPFIAAFALSTGNLKGAKNAVKDWTKVANPLGTVPIVSPFIDSVMGNKQYMEPGQRPLF